MGDFIEIPEAKYHRDLTRYSNSVLGLVAKDPRLLKKWIDGKPTIETTDDMRLGLYEHALVLEGSDAANERYPLPPSRHDAYRALTKAEQKRDPLPARVRQDPSPAGASRTMEVRSGENKSQWAAFERECSNRYIRHEQVPMATAMRKAILAHKRAGKLYKPGSFVPEMSMNWTCPHTGVPMRARLDGMHGARDNHVTSELKCTHLVNPETSLMSWIRCGWARQVAIQIDGYHECTGVYPLVYMVFAESTANAPIVVTRRVRHESPFYIAGRDGFAETPGYIELIEKAQRCRESGDYRHGWEIDTESEVTFPDWAMSRMENDAKLHTLTGARRPGEPQYGEVSYEQG